MLLPRRVARVWRRTGEVGLAGLRRRLTQPQRERARAALRARWLERHAKPLTDAELLDAVTPAARARLEPRRPGVAAELDALRTRLGRGTFFLDPDDVSLRREFRSRHPVACDALLAQADAAIGGDLSWVVPGGSADWHRALPGAGRWPLVPSAEVGIEAGQPVGDVRLAWEVGRCPHLVRLAQAAWLTGEARYAEGAVAVLRSFAAANPPGVGIAWAHAQEAGLRAVALLWAFQLLRDSQAFDLDVFRLWLGQLLAHAEFVPADLSDNVITHNHLVSELGALAVLGLALPELAGAEGWRRTGLALLWREVSKQVDDEGVSGEGSTHYHAFVLDSLVAVLLLAERRGCAVPEATRASIGRMVDFVALLLRPDGTLPAIGDTDAGRAWRLAAEPLDRRDLVAAAAVALRRPDWGAIAGDAAGAFWVTGGIRPPGAASRPPTGHARCFASAGIGVARTGFGPEAEQVVFRAGGTRFLADVATGHAHADALSILLRVGADDVVVDPGVFLYSEAAGWRHQLRGTAAHACVRVDERDQADVTSQRFGVPDLHPARWLSFAGSGDQLVAAAEHPASGTPRVRRRLVWLRPGFLAFCDDVLGDGEHTLEGWLPLPASRGDAKPDGADLTLSSGARVAIRLHGPIEDVQLLRPAASDGPGPGWISPRYGSRVPATALRVVLGRRTLPTRWVTVLQVGVGGDPPPVSFESLAGGAVRVRAGARAVSFGAEGSVRVEARR